MGIESIHDRMITVTCIDCHGEFERHVTCPRQVRCKECQHAHKLELKAANERDRVRKRRKLYTRQGTASPAYRVITDPDLDGGFSPGVTFSKTEVELMLQIGAFTPHTVLAGPYGGVYLVTGSASQKLTPKRAVDGLAISAVRA